MIGEDGMGGVPTTVKLAAKPHNAGVTSCPGNHWEAPLRPEFRDAIVAFVADVRRPV